MHHIRVLCIFLPLENCTKYFTKLSDVASCAGCKSLSYLGNISSIFRGGTDFHHTQVLLNIYLILIRLMLLNINKYYFYAPGRSILCIFLPLENCTKYFTKLSDAASCVGCKSLSYLGNISSIFRGGTDFHHTQFLLNIYLILIRLMLLYVNKYYLCAIDRSVLYLLALGKLYKIFYQT
jgi:hypothetical protein